MNKYIYLTLEERLNRIAEFLVKGINLYLQKEKEGELKIEQQTAHTGEN